MATAVQVFKDNMIRADTLAAEQEQVRKAREERARKVDQLTRDFDNMVSGVLGQLSSATAELQSTSESMRSEEHTSELQSLMRISYANFCSEKKIVTQVKECINYRHRR